MRKVILAALAVLVLVGAALGLTRWLTPAPQEAAGTGEVTIGGPFQLVDQNGQEVTDEKFRGRLMLVYFGYTFCPDVCPLGLTTIAEALDRLPAEDRDQIVPVFITVDPERDTPEAMKSYLGSFDPRIIGLSGDRPAVDAVVKAYRAYAKKVPLKDGDYTMDHTALVYLMGKDGKFVGAFNIEQPPAQAAAEWLRHS